MINTQKTITLIDLALLEVDNIVAKSKYYHSDEEPIISTKKVLYLLREEVEHNAENINERVLRAMHDLGMAAYKEFENTTLENILNNLTEVLYNDIPNYKNLEPLRSDLGKGQPI